MRSNQVRKTSDKSASQPPAETPRKEEKEKETHNSKASDIQAAKRNQPNPRPRQMPQISSVATPKKTAIRSLSRNRRVAQTRQGKDPSPKLPGQVPSKGLTVKVPKNRSFDPEQQINKRLQKSSPWYQSILDPLHGAGAKIPDECGVDTGTVQLVQRLSFNTNSDGTGGVKVLSPWANLAKGTPAQDVPGANYQYVNPGSDDLSIAWGTTNVVGGAFTDGTAWAFDGIEELQAITNEHRVVSAEMIVQPEPSLSDNKGEMTLFMSPYSVEESPLYGEYINRYKSVAIPLATTSNSAGVIRWFPMNRQDWSFKSFLGTNRDTLSDDDASVDSIPPWNFGCVTSGCADGVTFRVTIVVNFEFIPKYNTLNVLDASPSPQDATEVDLVEDWVQEMPIVTEISTRSASSSPSDVTPQHGENDSGTGFGMFFNVLTELAPYALEAAAMLI